MEPTETPAPILVNFTPKKRQGELMTPAEALEKSKKLPKGYALVPDNLEASKGSSLPQKRERKRINYSDYVTTPKSGRGKDEKKELGDIETTPLSTEKPTKVKKPKKTKKTVAASEESILGSLQPSPEPFEPEDEDSLEITPKNNKRTVDGKKKIEDSIKALGSRLEELTKTITINKKSRESIGSPEITSPKISSASPSTTPSSRPQRTKKRKVIKDLGSSSEVQLSGELKVCLGILNSMMSHKLAWPFNAPVDPVAWNIADYFDIIKNPMDFGTIKQQLEAGHYSNYEEFADDMRLVFTNATTYNAPKSQVWVMATTLSDLFEKKLSQAKKKLEEIASEMESTIWEIRDSMKQVQEEIRKLRQQKTQSKSGSSKGRSQKDDNRPMTLEEKKKLSSDINRLESDKLGKIVQIIHERIPNLAKNTAPDEIEIDIDILDTVTLRCLERYVKSALSRRKSKSSRSGANLPESKLKQAELSEHGTNKRIMDVERQLRELNNYSQSLSKKQTNNRSKKNDGSPSGGAQNSNDEQKDSSSGSESDSESESSGSSSSSSSSSSESESSDSESETENSKKNDSAKEKHIETEKKNAVLSNGSGSKTTTTTTTSTSTSNSIALSPMVHNNRNHLSNTKTIPKESVSSTSNISSSPNIPLVNGPSSSTSVPSASSPTAVTTNDVKIPPATESVCQPPAVTSEMETVPEILAPAATKKEVVVCNLDSWSNLDEEEKSEEKINNVGKLDEQLWREFKTRDLQNKQREKEREEQEEILRKEREAKEEERKKEEQRRKREQEELEQKKKIEEREQENEAIKKRELERQRAKEAREKQTMTINMNEQSLVMASFEENLTPNLELSELVNLRKIIKEGDVETKLDLPADNTN